MMRYDMIMFMAMLTVLAASGVHALLPPQQPIIMEPQPVSERVALLERDYEYLSRAIEEIKQLIKEQNDDTEKWIVIILGLLITGDRGLAILQRFKNNRKEK